MIYKFYTTLLNSFFLFKQDNNVIYWNRNEKLRFADFEGTASSKEGFEALSLIHVQIEYGILPSKIEYTISAYFEKKHSWFKTYDSDLLRHEQGHFDMGEVSARKIRKYFKQLNSFKDTFNIDQDLKKLVETKLKFDSLYDAETEHGSNKKVQHVWSVKIQKMLDSLNAYDKPEGTVILR